MEHLENYFPDKQEVIGYCNVRDNKIQEEETMGIISASSFLEDRSSKAISRNGIEGTKALPQGASVLHCKRASQISQCSITKSYNITSNRFILFETLPCNLQFKGEIFYKFNLKSKPTPSERNFHFIDLSKLHKINFPLKINSNHKIFL